MSRPEMTTSRFWTATAERAVKTAAQVAAALIGTGAVGITTLDWAQIGSVAATAAVVSVLTSLASDRVGIPGPSLVGEAITVRPEIQPIVEVEVPATQADTVALLPPEAVTAPLAGDVPDPVYTAAAMALFTQPATPADIPPPDLRATRPPSTADRVPAASEDVLA